MGLIMLFAGCTQAPTSTVALPPNFSTETSINVGETNYSMVLSRFGDGYWKAELLSPAAVKGLIFTISGEDTEVSFDGLRFTFDTGRFPVGSVVSSAIDSLDRLIVSPLDVINGEDQCLSTGAIDGKSYTLTLTKNHIPTKLELLDSGMTLEFQTFDIVEYVE